MGKNKKAKTEQQPSSATEAAKNLSDLLKNVIQVQNQINSVIGQEHAEMRKITLDYQAKKLPLYQQRKEALKSVPSFWALVLSSHDLIGGMMTDEDAEMLKFCTNITANISFDEEKKHQTTRIEFEFDAEKNPFFSDAQLWKQVTVSMPSDKGEAEQEEEFLEIKQSGEIHWKDEKKKQKQQKKQQQKNSKKRKHEEVSDESFFTMFETEGEMDADFCDLIQQDILEDPVAFYLSAIADEDVDGDDDDEEEEDDE